MAATLTTTDAQVKLDAINELLESFPADYSPSYWEDADDIAAINGKIELANKIRSILNG
jgi:hypothetical protein